MAAAARAQFEAHISMYRYQASAALAWADARGWTLFPLGISTVGTTGAGFAKQCHRNTLAAARADPELVPFLGFAMQTYEGTLLPVCLNHAWCRRRTDGAVVDTTPGWTEPAVRFGVEVSADELAAMLAAGGMGVVDMIQTWLLAADRGAV